MLLFAGLFGLVIFLWEHIGKVKDITFRPTYFINELTAILVKIATKLGVLFAQISSWLYEIKEILNLRLKELALTFFELFDSILKLFIKPTINFFEGYYETAKEYLSDNYLIYIGSFLLIMLLIVLVTNRSKIRAYFNKK